MRSSERSKASSRAQTRSSIEIIDTSVRGASRGTSGHTTGHTAGHTSGHTASAWSTTSSLIDAHHNGVELGFKFLLFGFEFLSGRLLVALEELESLGGALFNHLLVVVGELVLQLLVIERVLHLEAVGFEAVLSVDLLAHGIILSLILVSILHHLLDFLLGKTTLIVGDSDLLALASGLVHSVNVEDTVGVDVESDFDLGGAARCWGNALKVELAEQVVVLGHLTLALENLDQHTRLVVSVRGESLSLLGGDGGVSGDEDSHDTASGLNTLRKGRNIDKEEILDGFGAFAGEDCSLHGSTVGDSFVGVDGAVEGLAAEEVGEHGLDLGDTRGAANEHNLVHLTLGHVSVLEHVLHWGHALAELVHAKLLELGTRHVDVEVFTFGEGIAVDFGLMGRREGSLGLFALRSESSQRTVVSSDVNAGLLLELRHAEVDQDVVEIFTAEMGVTIRGLHFEDAVLNGEERHIKSATTKVENEHIALTLLLLVETVGDSGGGRLIDDSLHGEARNGASVLGGLSLRVVEVSGDSDHSGFDFLAQVSLSNLFHFVQHHRRDFLSLELLGLTLEVDNDEGLFSGA